MTFEVLQGTSRYFQVIWVSDEQWMMSDDDSENMSERTHVIFIFRIFQVFELFLQWLDNWAGEDEKFVNWNRGKSFISQN